MLGEKSTSNLKNKKNKDYTKVFIQMCTNKAKNNISSKDISKIMRLSTKKENGTSRPILGLMLSRGI